MTPDNPKLQTTQQRSSSWTWMICLILFSATFLNYSNRYAFTENSDRVQESFQTQKEGYGTAAGMFAFGFALGGLTFGYLADKISVRILYPVVVVVWSVAGMSSGMVSSLWGLGVSRFLLGLFEAGHWPCALRTTQRVFKPGQRTLANSILQSGASIGAAATPLIVLVMYDWNPDQWRWTFLIVGVLGIPWAIWWWFSVSESDVRRPVIQTDETSLGRGTEQELQEIPFSSIFKTRRWWLLLIIIVGINTPWHFVRVWLPDTLQHEHGYSTRFILNFRSWYYVASFFGSLSSGWLVGRLVRSDWNVHRARLMVFLIFTVLSTFAVPAAFLHRGNLLLGCLLIVGFGSLGLFPIYYSLNQEISAKHQGKVGGTLSFSTWGILAVMHPAIGWLSDHFSEIRPSLFAGVSLGPLIAFAVLFLFWGKRPTVEDASTNS